MFFLNQTSTIFQMGLIYSIVALGVYITYKILGIADLSVDGTFPLGGVVFSVLLTLNVPWIICMIAGFIAGFIAGLVTGLMHVKLKINSILSGIITMTALLSINYLIAGGPMISFANISTLLYGEHLNGLSYTAACYIQVGLTLVIAVIIKILLDLFYKTKMGFMLRATGDNAQIVTEAGKDTDFYKMFGLGLSNGLVALAGTLYCTFNMSYNANMGTGTVVIALASVIIGCVIARRIKFMSDTTGVIMGSLFYYAVLSVAMLVLGSDYTKLVVAVLFVFVLLLDDGILGRGLTKIFNVKEAKHAKTRRNR